MPDNEQMARIACADHGYQFLALVDDQSGDALVAGFTYITPGQDSTAPNWVSLKAACFEKWAG